MILEAQLRALAELSSSEQRAVSAEEAMSRAEGRELLGDPPRRRQWALVAATVVLVVGLAVLVARIRSPHVDPAPVVTVPGSTVPAHDPVPATSVPNVTPTPRGALSETLVNEPTLEYRDGVEWWVPGRLPEGLRYGYALDTGALQTIRLLADDRSTIDVEFGADAATIDEVAAGSAAERLGEESWLVVDSDGAGVAARAVDGRLLVVRGSIDGVRTVAGDLELWPETDLVRPPFHADGEPGPVVITLPAEAVGGDEPFELRAHTDGLFTTVGGEIKQVSRDDPLAFGDYVYDLTGDADSYPVVMSGVALDGVEQIDFGLLGGDGFQVTTVGSDRFAERFYAFVTDVPASVLEQYEQGGLEKLTRWTFTFVDGEQRVYDEPGSENCVNCDGLANDQGDDEGIEATPDAAPATSSPIAIEPTNVYGNEEWVVPAQEAEGLEFAYAEMRTDGDDVFQLISYDDVDPAVGGHSVATYSHSDGRPFVTDPAASATAVDIGGVTWWWEEVAPATAGGVARGTLSGVFDGRTVDVRSDLTTAVSLAETLELVPASRLPRPPFRGDESSSVVVARLTGVATVADVPTELRAATDGVRIWVLGGTPSIVSMAEPVVFGSGRGPVPQSGGGADVFVISGYTAPEVATLEFEQLDGEVITVEPEDLSGRFGVKFFLVAVEVPPGGIGDTYVSVVPSVVARDADGDVLAAISEPF